MQIGKVNFGGIILAFPTGGNQSPNISHVKNQLNKGDSFEKRQPAKANETAEGIISEDSPIYYIRIFDRLTRNLSSNNKASRLTPNDAGRELIKILKDGKAIKVLKTAYENERYGEVDDFLSSFVEIDNSLHDSDLDENTYLAIKALAIPIKGIADEFDERDDIEIPEDTPSLRDCETGNYFSLEDIVKVEAEGTKAEKSEKWKSIEARINKAHTIEEFPIFNFSIPSSPNFDPKIWMTTLEKLTNIISQARQKFPCNPENYIPEDAENDYEEE